MKVLELLAPAKNLECGIAAIDHGADAVYIGAPRFGARAAAGNSIEDIRQLCNYAHQYAVKVYVTVNTIVYDDELDDVSQLLNQLKEAGADAVLVQDMALLTLHSSLPYHASTQTDNRTPEKVAWLRSLGFSRVVLARELSLEEIRAIHQAVPDVELEVFVHGALCVSFSGLCYASQHCFGRSANRGECAQFCRMAFDLLDADGHVVEHNRHLLSLKDMCQIDLLEQLAEAGVTSFKIEGRLKDVAYVKNVTAAYSERLNQLVVNHPDEYCRASMGKCSYTFVPDVSRTFNRGFTHYFIHGRQPDIASFDTPKAMGQFVGTVKEVRRDSFNVAGTARFSNGDGLCFINVRHQLEGFRVNRAEGNRIFPLKMPTNIRPGIRLYRNNDQEFERLLAHPSAERKIPVTMSLEPIGDNGTVDCGYSLTINDGKNNAVVKITAQHDMAQKPQHDRIVSELTKLGNTPYACNSVIMADDFNYFIPASRLAELRRMAVKALMSVAQKTAPSPSVMHPLPTTPPMPVYDESISYNIANRLSRQFYACQGLQNPSPALELHEPPYAKLMQCRHCVRYALGYCVKHGGKKPVWREPLRLKLADGSTFRLEFDCQHCQMNVYASFGLNNLTFASDGSPL